MPTYKATLKPTQKATEWFRKINIYILRSSRKEATFGILFWLSKSPSTYLGMSSEFFEDFPFNTYPFHINNHPPGIVNLNITFEVAFRFCICGFSFRGELLSGSLLALRLLLPLRHLLRHAPHHRGPLRPLHRRLHLPHQVQLLSLWKEADICSPHHQIVFWICQTQSIVFPWWVIGPRIKIITFLCCM